MYTCYWAQWSKTQYMLNRAQGTSLLASSHWRETEHTHKERLHMTTGRRLQSNFSNIYKKKISRRNSCGMWHQAVRLVFLICPDNAQELQSTGTTNPTTQSLTPRGLYLQQNCCENLKYSMFGKSLCTYERCWKWCPRASIQAWTA
jgi:hypothetical protein